MESDHEDLPPTKKRMVVLLRNIRVNKAASSSSNRNSSVSGSEGNETSGARSNAPLVINMSMEPGGSCSLSPRTSRAVRDLEMKDQKCNERMFMRALPFNEQSYERKLPNIVHYVRAKETGLCQNLSVLQAWKGSLVRTATDLFPRNTISMFNRRVTVITWHPLMRNVLAAASKGGELILCDTFRPLNDYITLPGAIKNLKIFGGGSLLTEMNDSNAIGPGGSVLALKFHPEIPTSVYVACLTGKVRLVDFYNGVQNTDLISTHNHNNWFCSLDILPERKLLVTGDCTGNVYFIDTNGKSVHETRKLHKSKVSHAEFCSRNSDLFVTASNDHTVKLWDLRMMSKCKGKAEPVYVLNHSHAVNSAYFNSDCSTLLTTDQCKEIRVYASADGRLQKTIIHPHRQFQHLTPIKATWHPFGNVIVVGRFPDERHQKNDVRSIDFFDGDTGELMHRLCSKHVLGITTLNSFNCIGDVLASGSGRSIIFWKNRNLFGPQLKSEDGPLSPNPDSNDDDDDDIENDDSPRRVANNNRSRRVAKKTMPKARRNK